RRRASLHDRTRLPSRLPPALLFALDVFNILIDGFDIDPYPSDSQQICEVERVMVIEIMIEPAMVFMLERVTCNALHIIPILASVAMIVVVELMRDTVLLLNENIIIVLVICRVVLSKVRRDPDFDFKVHERIRHV